MGLCNKDLTSLLMHWSYVFLALSHRFEILVYLAWNRTACHMLGSCESGELNTPFVFVAWHPLLNPCEHPQMALEKKISHCEHPQGTPEKKISNKNGILIGVRWPPTGFMVKHILGCITWEMWDMAAFLHSANERQHYFVMTSLIGWAKAHCSWIRVIFWPFIKAEWFWGNIKI